MDGTLTRALGSSSALCEYHYKVPILSMQTLLSLHVDLYGQILFYK